MKRVVKEGMGFVVLWFTVMGYLSYYFVGMHPTVCVVLFGTIAVISVAIIGLSQWLSKKWSTLLGFIWVGFLMLLFFNPVSLFAILYGANVTKEVRKVLKPKTYKLVGEKLALYCQSYELLQSPSCGTAYSDSISTWLPKGLGIEEIQRDGASLIGLGGGPLYDYGFELSLDTKLSTVITNVWQLYYYSEGEKKRHLLTIRMDSARKLSADDLRLMKASE